MKNMLPVLLSLVLLISNLPAIAQSAGSQIAWQELAPGLQLGEYTPTRKSVIGDSKITILRVNPRLYAFRLLTATQRHDQRRTAAQWCQQEKLVACINAGMYQPDGQSVGYLRNGKNLHNPNYNQDNCLLVFTPTDTLSPAIKLIDRSCESDWEQQSWHYQCCVQSTRMIDCNQQNTWVQQPKMWSSAVWGTDQNGYALLLFCRSPYSMHDYVDILLNSPLRIGQAMYLEGGPEASLSIKSGSTVRELFGSYETGFTENDDSRAAFPLPNVIGVIQK